MLQFAEDGAEFVEPLLRLVGKEGAFRGEHFEVLDVIARRFCSK